MRRDLPQLEQRRPALPNLFKCLRLPRSVIDIVEILDYFAWCASCRRNRFASRDAPAERTHINRDGSPLAAYSVAESDRLSYPFLG